MDLVYLRRAIELAKESLVKGSVPIGAVITNKEGVIIAEGYNEIKLTNDPTAHAEVVCMRKALDKIIYKLNPEPTFLYTTLEPCFACGFFITRTNIKNVMWALNDPYNGGVDFLKNDQKLAEVFKTINLVAEPNLELANDSKRLMSEYYTKKGEDRVAKMFL